MYDKLKSTLNLEHSPSIAKLVISNSKLSEIKERKRLREKRPSPGDHNTN